jgi:two-component system, chemotaxis family, CheB/CheR fusion protein
MSYFAADTLTPERVQILLETIPDLITITTADGLFTYVSPASKTMLDFSPSEMEGRSSIDFVHPDDRDPLWKATEELIASGKNGKTKFRCLKKNGDYIWVEITGKVLYDESGQPREIHSCVRDISDRVQNEQELEKKHIELLEQIIDNEKVKRQLQREKLFKESIIEYSHVGICAMDTELNITEWNPAMEIITGFKATDVLNRNWLEVYPSARNSEAHSQFLKVLKGEVIFIPEKKFMLRDGYHSSYLAPLLDNEGDIIGMVTLVMDITERKNIELQLKESENFLKQVADSSPNIIYVLDIIEKKNVYVNRELTDMLGYVREDLNDDLETLKLKLIHPDDLPTVDKRWKRFEEAKDGELIEDEIRVLGKNGKWFWVNTSAVVFKRTPEGRVHQVLGTVKDITEKKEAERTMLHLRNTEALMHKKDEFMSIASHELKTPLTSIKAYLQLLDQSYDSLADENKRQFIARTCIYAEKLSKLVEDLLDISKIQAGKMAYNMTEFDAGEWLTESIETYQRISPKHRITRQGNIEHTMLKGDKQRLEQVLSNLLSNAIKYSPSAGEVIVKVSRTVTDLRIEVKDFGIGIPPDKQAFVFDRFYRVEGSRAFIPGLGIGLYLSKEIITRHGGRIGVESREEQGSTFYFTLPL